jgi:predicted alpha/beta hydrolase
MDVQARPLYFRSGGVPLFAWLHAAAPAPARAAPPGLGLVICQPFGYEALCARLSLRQWAQAAAAAGIPTLRFDYAGSGDSVDGDTDADQLGVWSRNIADAAAELRRLCGVERVCALGLRLGALAAVLAATEHGGIDALAAVVPVTGGRRYLRELRTLQGSLSFRSGADDSAALEVTGFRLSAATVARLHATGVTELTAASSVPVRQVLIIDRDDLPQAARWAQMLTRQGAQTRYVAVPGYTGMSSRPHTSIVPQAMIAATMQWLHGLAGPAASAGADIPAALAETAPASIRLRANGAEVLERAVFIDDAVGDGAGRRLFAVLDEPAVAGGGGHGVILLNAGASYHIGPNRMYVTLARRWAARGYRVLRMDLAGLGDSGTRGGRPLNEVYPPGALDDVRAAVEFMRRRAGAGELTLAGLCSGAYHCLRAGVAGLPVQRLLMINPLTYFWKQGMTLSDLQDAQVLRGPAIYRERMRSGKSWRKLLTGRVDPRPIARTLLQRAWLALDSRRRDLARRLRMPLADDLGSELQALCARGVRVVFVFARGDPGVALLKVQAGSALRRLAGRCRIHFIDGADHIFSQSRPRAQLEQLLEQELCASSLPAAAERADGARGKGPPLVSGPRAGTA